MSTTYIERECDQKMLQNLLEDLIEQKKNSYDKIKLINKNQSNDNSKMIQELLDEVKATKKVVEEVKRLLVEYFKSQGFDIENSGIQYDQLLEYVKRFQSKIH